ncbi:MAG: SGNH/GDSL hydrolase family protein [Chryseolinea sp.]
MKRLLAVFLLISSQTMAQKLVIQDNVRFLALGDSYTIGESVTKASRWPFLLIDSLHSRGIDGLEPSIIATTGWRTDDLKKAISKAKLKPEYTLVSLLIGVNNFYQGKTVEAFAPEFEELLLTAIRLAKGNKSSVFVVSIPDYGYTPFGKDNQEKITKGINSFNEVSKRITEALGVKYINITDISRRGIHEPDLIATDGLHPSEKMYAEWVLRIISESKIEAAKAEEN